MQVIDLIRQCSIPIPSTKTCSRKGTYNKVQKMLEGIYISHYTHLKQIHWYPASYWMLKYILHMLQFTYWRFLNKPLFVNVIIMFVYFFVSKVTQDIKRWHKVATGKTVWIRHAEQFWTEEHKKCSFIRKRICDPSVVPAILDPHKFIKAVASRDLILMRFCSLAPLNLMGKLLLKSIGIEMRVL